MLLTRINFGSGHTPIFIKLIDPINKTTSWFYG